VILGELNVFAGEARRRSTSGYHLRVMISVPAGAPDPE
jgi:hypothetical protein